MDVKTEETLSGTRLLLHFLLPALALFLGYVAVGKPLSTALNLPSMIGFLVTVPLVLVPVELGWLYYLGYRKHQRLTLKDIVLYRESLTWRQYLVLIPVIFVCMLAGFILGSFGDEWVYRVLFVGWWPDYLRYEDSPDGLSLSMQRLVLILSLIFVGIIGPVVEELYFRGYVLPRQAHQGWFAPIINSALFAAYHLLTPWLFISRTIGMAIVAAFTQWKRNVYLAIAVHVAANSVFLISALLATFSS